MVLARPYTKSVITRECFNIFSIGLRQNSPITCVYYTSRNQSNWRISIHHPCLCFTWHNSQKSTHFFSRNHFRLLKLETLIFEKLATTSNSPAPINFCQLLQKTTILPKEGFWLLTAEKRKFSNKLHTESDFSTAIILVPPLQNMNDDKYRRANSRFGFPDLSYSKERRQGSKPTFEFSQPVFAYTVVLNLIFVVLDP